VVGSSVPSAACIGSPALNEAELPLWPDYGQTAGGEGSHRERDGATRRGSPETLAGIGPASTHLPSERAQRLWHRKSPISLARPRRPITSEPELLLRSGRAVRLSGASPLQLHRCNHQSRPVSRRCSQRLDKRPREVRSAITSCGHYADDFQLYSTTAATTLCFRWWSQGPPNVCTRSSTCVLD
jgi:hypothetical protein